MHDFRFPKHSQAVPLPVAEPACRVPHASGFLSRIETPLSPDVLAAQNPGTDVRLFPVTLGEVFSAHAILAEIAQKAAASESGTAEWTKVGLFLTRQFLRREAERMLEAGRS